MQYRDISFVSVSRPSAKADRNCERGKKSHTYAVIPQTSEPASRQTVVRG
jgi:hypothetical protein